jgi:hypothetical protein
MLTKLDLALSILGSYFRIHDASCNASPPRNSSRPWFAGFAPSWRCGVASFDRDGCSKSCSDSAIGAINFPWIDQIWMDQFLSLGVPNDDGCCYCMAGCRTRSKILMAVITSPPTINLFTMLRTSAMLHMPMTPHRVPTTARYDRVSSAFF